MATRTTKKPEKEALPEDREQLRRIARKMLDKLERSVDNIDESEENSHEKLFAAKNSLVGALTALSELLTDLGDTPVEEIAPEEEGIKMDERDIANVKYFLHKSQAIEEGRDPYAEPFVPHPSQSETETFSPAHLSRLPP